MAGKISDKQKQILEFIKEEQLAKGYPPSVREICDAVGLRSTSSVHSHLNTLEKNGFIRRDPTHPRAIEILDDDFNLQRKEMVSIPLLGNVAAGEPILAVDQIRDYFPIPAEYMPKGQCFMVSVKGDSMINVGIYSGDLLVIEQTNTAKNGDIVLALIDDSTTVKRFYKENGHYRLQPENDQMDPIITDQCQVIGKVVSLFRKSVF